MTAINAGHRPPLNTKIKRFVRGYRTTVPFAEGIRRTLAWFDADPARKQIDERGTREALRCFQSRAPAYRSATE